MSETFPSFKRLKTVFFSDTYCNEIIQQIKNDMESEKLVDLISLVASSFTSVDIDILLETVKLENSERLGDDWILS